MILNSFNEILIATVGLTPETVTETIYYYYKQNDDKRLFSDFKLVTTEKGRAGIIKELFDNGWLGKLEKALPRDVSFDAVSEEPIHIDFMRVIQGSKIDLEIPAKFINADKSPGLKKGGVLNIVRRKVELKCPAENIPKEIIVDLDNTEINTSLKISSVKLPEGVVPTITDRDFVIGTVVAPTILVEPEKTEEATADGEATTEVAVEGAETTATEGAAKTEDGKEKSAKTSDDKTKATPSDKSQGSSKDKETKKK